MRHHCCNAWDDFEEFINWFESIEPGKLVMPNFPCKIKKSSPWRVRYCPTCGAKIPEDIFRKAPSQTS